jgi:hypothetical protein
MVKSKLHNLLSPINLDKFIKCVHNENRNKYDAIFVTEKSIFVVKDSKNSIVDQTNLFPLII